MRMHQTMRRSFIRPSLLGGLAGFGDAGASLENQALLAHSRNDHAGAQSLYTQAAQAYEGDAAGAQMAASMPGGNTSLPRQLYDRATAARQKATEEEKHILAQQAADAAAAKAIADAQAAAQAEAQRQAAAQAEAQRQAQLAAQAAQAEAERIAAQQAAAIAAAQKEYEALQAQQTVVTTTTPPPIITPTPSATVQPSPTPTPTPTQTQQKADVVTTTQAPAIIQSAVAPIGAEDFTATAAQADLLPLGYDDLATTAAPETPATPNSAPGLDWVKFLPWIIGLALLAK